MKITVKFIGRYKELVGKQDFILEMNSGDSIWHVVDRVVMLFPSLENDKKFMMVLKNDVFTNREEKLIDGDEITLVPPVVSGG